MITISINGEIKEVPDETKLSGLLELFSLPKQRIAIELNRNVIRRQDWESVELSANDKIEVIHFVGGG